MLESLSLEWMGTQYIPIVTDIQEINKTARTVVEADTPRNPTHVVLNTKVEDATRSELVDVPRSPTAREVEGPSSTVGQDVEFFSSLPQPSDQLFKRMENRLVRLNKRLLED
nr:hypothetical protein Itr_chr13CG17820 [Ipomoea trifida]